jgi:hypothetical protein
MFLIDCHPRRLRHSGRRLQSLFQLSEVTGLPALVEGGFGRALHPDALPGMLHPAALTTPKYPSLSVFLEGSPFAYLQGPLGIQEAKKLDELGHDPGPAGLMACAKPRAIVAVEVLIE